MEDIAPELLKAVQAAFNLNMANESIAKKKAKIDSGEASYADAEEYAYDVGHALAEAMKECVSSDVLPDGRMYYNIAQKLLQPVLENNYNAMCDVVEKVQAHLNEEAGIGIKPIIPPLNQDRIDGLIKNASDAEHYDDVAKSVSDGTTNFTQNVIDESIEANANFHYEAGMEPKIVRTAAGGDSCDMCLGLQGTYSYPVDKSLYMRHKECRCIVEYVPKDGKRQNVHSRQWKTDPELIEARKKVGLEEKRDDEKLINDAINSQMELLKKYGSETNLYINGSFDELNNWDNFKKITEKNGKDILVEMSKNPNEWENIIKMQSEDTFKPLVDKLLSVADDKELKALNTWSASTYSLINRYMRYGIDSGEIAENAAKNIKSVLDKVTTDEVIIVHRGTGTKHMFENIVGDWRKDPNVLVGQSFSDAGFVATSPFDGGGFGGTGVDNAELFIKIPPGTHGAYIAQQSHIEREKEFLLQNGYKYEIVKAEYRTNIYYPEEIDLKVWCEVRIDE